MKWRLLLLWLLVVSSSVQADELLMARIHSDFPEAMQHLQDAIRLQGYTVSRVQRVDVGLKASGFQTAEYRIVFYGQPDEIRKLADTHFELIPYLPLNIVIFAEGEDTLILAPSPKKLATFYSNPELKGYFDRWEKDVREIFSTVKASDRTQ